MGKEYKLQFGMDYSVGLGNFLIKNMLSVSASESSRQCFKCFDINGSTINPLGVSRNLSNIECSAFYENTVIR